MGIFDKIKKKVKSVYTKADTAVGGRLPGGVTPSQVQASKTSTPTSSTASRVKDKVSSAYTSVDRAVGGALPGGVEPTGAKEVLSDIGRGVKRVAHEAGQFIEGKPVTIAGRDISTGFGDMVDPETGEPIELQMGTLPIGLGGAAAGGKFATKAIVNLGKGATPGQVSAAVQAANRGTIVNVAKAKNYWSAIGKLLPNAKQATTTAKAGQSAINTKTAALTTSVISKFFGTKALIFYGGWASSIGMGLWANAEAPEGIMFPVNKFLIPEAERTGDWTAVDEAIDLADEISDLNVWEKIVAMSPLALIPGALNKLKGNIAGKEVMKKYTEDQKDKQETGDTETQYWEQRKADEAEQDRVAIDYYNEQRKLMIEWELDAKENQRDSDASFWRKEAEAQSQREKEDREAIALFWLEYKKLAQQIADNSRPSNLNFGLL